MLKDDTPWMWTGHLPRTVAYPASDVGSLDEADVCVVGSGIAGLTTAYALARSGRSVVVLEARGVGSGETSHTSAHLASALDDRFTVLERLHGLSGSRLAAESHATAIDFLERLVDERRIDCDFSRVDGYLISATGDEEALTGEYAAATRAALTVERVAAVPGGDAWSGPALRFPRQGALECGREDLGLLMPRFTVQQQWQSPQRTGEQRSAAREGDPGGFPLPGGQPMRCRP